MTIKIFVFIMPFEDKKIIWKNLLKEFSQYQESHKVSFFIYADLECLIEKIDGCKNNPENSLEIRVGVYNIIIWTHRN